MIQISNKVLILLILSMLIIPMPSIALAADGVGQFDLDVVYAIDVSGSMNRADSERLALTAASLFIDMCEGSDTRVGYVMYSHVVTAQKGLSDLISFSRDIKRDISKAAYLGDTDTGLGLETALSILLREGSHRKPVIILLSDGNTDLPNGPRTAAESLAALEQAKQDAARLGIPVYTIGFNHDGSLDEATMQAIAQQTGGIARGTRSANDLPRILREIYGDLTGASSESITMEATGFPQQVEIPINDNSIYKTTVTIMSSRAVKDISLAMPDGSPGTFTSNSDPQGKYTLLSVFKPVKGDWVLTFTGTKGDLVYIDLLSIYDLALVLDLPRTSVGSADFSWRLEDENGVAITDQDLLDVLEPTLIATNLTTGKKYVEIFPAGQTAMSVALDAGDYEAYLSVDNHGIVRTSNTQTFSVPFAPPLTLTEKVRKNSDTYKVSLMTIFNKKTSVPLSNIVNYTRDNLPLTVSEEAGPWAEQAAFVYDAAAESLELSALKPGKTEIRVTASDPHGHSVDFYLAVNVISGLLPIIALAVLLLLAVLAAFLIAQAKKPTLNMPMSKLYIKMTLPDVFAESPPEAALTLPPLKGKKTLRELINMNVSIAEPYRAAFEGINWFADGTVFCATSKDLLEIKVPANPGYTVKVDKQAGKNTAAFNKNGGAEIRIGSGGPGFDNYGEYIIVFGNAGPSYPANEYYDAADGFDIGGADKKTGGSFADDDFW